MTDLASQAIKPTVEQLRAGISRQDVKELLRNAEHRTQRMRAEFDAIDADENLSIEGKRAAAQQVIERHAGALAQDYRSAREKLESSIKAQHNFSIPFPDSKTFAGAKIQDSGEMLAVQNEENAISARLEGRSLQELTKERTKNPRDKGMRQSPGSTLEALQREYGTALEVGSFEGRCRALAVARVCEGMGEGVFDQVVDPYRKQIHHDAIETAQRLQAALFTVPTDRSLAAMAHNPFDGVEDRQRRIGTYSATRKGMRVGSNQPLFPNKQRKRLWK